MIEGNPGDGKSTFVVALAAAVSAGAQLPFLERLASGGVLVLSAEDDPARVEHRGIAPTKRVMAASLGKMPTTSVRRLTSPISRSSGLVECSLTLCWAGKVM